MSFRSSSEKGLSNGAEFLQTQLLLGRALQKNVLYMEYFLDSQICHLYTQGKQRVAWEFSLP